MEIQAVFKKIAPVKKIEAIKKAILVVFTAYRFRYGIINVNETTDLYIDYGQEIQSTNNQEIYAVGDNDSQSMIESKSVNSTQVKTGSGAVIEIQKQHNQTSKTLKSTLETRGGNLGKSGPGPRAKVDARNNKGSGSASSIIPGASAYTPQHVYRLYRETSRRERQVPTTQTHGGKPNADDGPTPRVAPSVSPNRQCRITSEPLKIKSEHQEEDVIITQKDIKKWITPVERKETANQGLNEQKVEKKFVDTVEKPTEVLDGVHIHREQKDCKVYIKDIEASDGTKEKLAIIADSKTGRAYLGSTLNKQEYSTLKKLVK